MQSQSISPAWKCVAILETFAARGFSGFQRTWAIKYLLTRCMYSLLLTRHADRPTGNRACGDNKTKHQSVHYDHITSDQHLHDFCETIAAAPIIAFDTEFVSEDSFLPELCLIQLAAAE